MNRIDYTTCTTYSTAYRTLRGALLAACLAAISVLGAAGSASAMSLLISEVFYDAVGSDDGQSFVELSGTPGTILDGLVLEGINGSGGGVTVTIVLTGTVAPDGLFVIADVDTSGQTQVVNADLLADFDFQNGPDSIVLRDALGVRDAVGYGVFDASLVFAGEGQPAVDPAAGSSLARAFADVDTDDNAMDWIDLSIPTPGEAEFLVPEPPTGVLGLVAIATLLCQARVRAAGQRRG